LLELRHIKANSKTDHWFRICSCERTPMRLVSDVHMTISLQQPRTGSTSRTRDESKFGYTWRAGPAWSPAPVWPESPSLRWSTCLFIQHSKQKWASSAVQSRCAKHEKESAPLL
jgi:hypothetical protein